MGAKTNAVVKQGKLTKTVSTRGVLASLRRVRKPVETLDQAGVLRERAGVIGVRLRDCRSVIASTRSSRAIAASTSRNVALAVLVVVIMHRNSNSDTNDNDSDDGDY